VDVSWPLVGRRAELEALAAVLGDTRAGGIVLVGVPGVGKTRLAREALARAEAAGRDVEWVAATRAAASIPFGAVSHLLPAAERLGDDRLDILRRAAALLAERGRERLLVLGVDDAGAAHAELGDRGVPFLAEIHHPPWGGSRFFCVDPDGYLVEIEEPG